jgi:hypothetical protein
VAANAVSSFAFNAERHEYTINRERVPSVTDVLWIVTEAELAKVPPATLERARRRGEDVHQAINLHNRDALGNLADLAPEVQSAVGAWGRFLSETGCTVIASEQPVYHDMLGYAGTPDVVLEWPRRGLVIPDVKATYAVPGTVGAQTAAYAEAWHEMHGKRGRPPSRCCIHIKDGAYEVHPRKDGKDWSLFVSCLNVYRYLEKIA